MPLGSKDNPKEPTKPSESQTQTSESTPTPSTGPVEGVMSPHASGDPAFQDDPAQNIDPTKVVGTYAEQPDPNDDRPAPLPNIPKGVHEAPADDEPGAGAIGDGSQ